jgi:hypothetical protein
MAVAIVANISLSDIKLILINVVFLLKVSSDISINQIDTDIEYLPISYRFTDIKLRRTSLIQTQDLDEHFFITAR